MTNTQLTRRPLARRSSIALAVMALAAVPALSGCFNGQGATTTVQSGMNSGDGTMATAGSMKVVNVTIVIGEGVGPAQLIGNIINQGTGPDTLNSIEVAGKLVNSQPPIGEIAPAQSVAFGYQDSEIKVPVRGLAAAISTYVPVTFNFQNAGTLKISVLTVPDTGIYAGITNTVKVENLLPTPLMAVTEAPRPVN